MDIITKLLLDIGASWLRLFAALILSLIFSIFIGVLAATRKRAEKIILPVLDVLQTIPILGFFPVVIYLIVLVLPGPVGVNAAVVFLIFTSMVWNIAFGVYEAVKAMPTDIVDVASISHLPRWQKFSRVYVPAAMPRIAYQTVISWSVGLFYLVTSEIFSTGNAQFSVTYGIGAEIATILVSQNVVNYVLALAFFIAAVLLTRFLFLGPLLEYSERFSFKEETEKKESRTLRFYSKIAGVFRRFVPEDGIHVGHRRKQKPVTPTPGPARGRGEGLAVPVFLAGLAILIFAVAAYTGNVSQLPLLGVSLAYSFARVWIIYIICVAISVPLGILIATSTRAFSPVLTSLQVISAIPATILLPALVALLYALPFAGEWVAVSVILLAMIWYLLFSIIAGMRSVPTQMLELRHTLKLKWHTAWRRIYVPAILPSFVTGSITAVGGAWNALIVAEYFSTQLSAGSSTASCASVMGVTCIVTQVTYGIGKFLDQAVFSGNIPLMILALLAMTAMVVAINRFGWQRVYNFVTKRYSMMV